MLYEVLSFGVSLRPQGHNLSMCNSVYGYVLTEFFALKWWSIVLGMCSKDSVEASYR